MTDKNDVYKNPEAVADMVARYKAVCGEGFTDEDRANVVEELAADYGKSAASIRGKLYRENVYVAKTYKTKTGANVVKKSTLVDIMASMVGATLTDSEGASFEKATKSALNKVIAGIQRLHDEIDLVDVEVDDGEDETVATAT